MVLASPGAMLVVRVVAASLLVLAACAGSDAEPSDPDRADSFGDCETGSCAPRRIELVFTAPFCDVCTGADKDVLLERSPIIRRVVELIDGAASRIDVAQFTFSRREIEAALIRAHERGVAVRLAINAAQDQPHTAATRLAEAGIEVRFVTGHLAQGAGFDGLQHAKFMLVDEATLLTGSNNWSSTGTSINEENTIVVEAPPDDPLLVGFACHFDTIWTSRPGDAIACSNEEVAFTPGTAARNRIRDQIRASTRSIDVLMHHFTFAELVRELARAQERGVAVRLVLNEADRAAHTGRDWDRLQAAGGELRFKRGNPDEFQLMHHKLAVFDGEVVINGSGNWSGNAFFNNHENYVSYREPHVVRGFEDLYEELWTASLSAASIDAGRSAAEQHAADTRAFFGNLHAHFSATDGDRLLDDGIPARLDPEGRERPVDAGASPAEAARHAFEYARDRAGLDFLALSPHCSDDDPGDQPNMPNMSTGGYGSLGVAARQVTGESGGLFVALASMEWSTNSTGNHVNVLGAGEVAKVRRGRFDLFYDGYLRRRAGLGERPLVMLNHPRTFRVDEDSLAGNWDQIYGVPLTEIRNNSERRNKFNDYGLDDYPPLRDVRERWISGEELPDPEVVDATLLNLWSAASPYVRLMEVTLGRGTELAGEDPQNPSLVDRDGQTERRTRVESDWHYYLTRGFKLAPAASHDNHWANWGTGHTSRTGVVARSLGEKQLLEAVHRRAVFASEDQNLSIRFYADGRVPMGGETATGAARLDGAVLVEDPDYHGPYRVRLLRGRIGGAVEEVARIEVGEDGWVPLDLELPGKGEHFFYVDVLELAADRMAWSAPIWIESL
jgi:sugar-specific transcriptional regulator TrmB